MKDLINKNFLAENIEEESLNNKIKQMKNSNQIPIFIEKIKRCISNDVKIFSYRIKEPFSDIRTYRLAGYEESSKVHDLLGMLFIVDKM